MKLDFYDEKGNKVEGLTATVSMCYPQGIENTFLYSIYGLLHNCISAEHDKIPHDYHPNPMDYTIPALTMSVFWLEGIINRIIFAIIHDTNNLYQLDIDTTELKKMRLDTDKSYTILDKYEKLYSFIKKTTLPKNNPEYDNVNTLIKVRNQFAHTKTYVLSSDDKEEKDIYVRLLRGKYEVSLKNNNLQYYHRYVPYFNSNCICWAVDSILNYVENYWKSIIPSVSFPVKTDFLKEKINSISWKKKTKQPNPFRRDMEDLPLIIYKDDNK